MMVDWFVLMAHMNLRLEVANFGVGAGGEGAAGSTCGRKAAQGGVSVTRGEADGAAGVYHLLLNSW